METIGFVILWLFAAMQMLGVVLHAFMLGKPKTGEYDNTSLMISAGAALLFLYGLMLVVMSR